MIPITISPTMLTTTARVVATPTPAALRAAGSSFATCACNSLSVACGDGAATGVEPPPQAAITC